MLEVANNFVLNCRFC